MKDNKLILVQYSTNNKPGIPPGLNYEPSLLLALLAAIGLITFVVTLYVLYKQHKRNKTNLQAVVNPSKDETIPQAAVNHPKDEVIPPRVLNYPKVTNKIEVIYIPRKISPTKATVSKTASKTASTTVSKKITPPQTPSFESLELQLQELTSLAWTTEASFRYYPFALNSTNFENSSGLDSFVETLLRHARNITPGFNVPFMTPRIVVEEIPSAAGLFQVDEEGWVTIKVGRTFFGDRLAARAILAHEVCHYILENSGIRKDDFLLNERYTDLCMFVCGFGEIFTSGYKREMAQSEYRSGHRLGYLSDAEYQHATSYVMQLRQTNKQIIISSNGLDTLKKELQSLVHEQEICERLVQAERKRSPHKSETELYKDAIYRVKRDRGY